MKASNAWKWGGLAFPFLGIAAAWAAFTSPPFNAGPASTHWMAQQCYSALVERCAAVCSNAPAVPEPANTFQRLEQYKVLASNLVVGSWWIETNAPISETNRFTPASLANKAGVPAGFWTNTPLAGASTATNGWHGLRAILTNLQWTATEGGNNCGTNLYVFSSGTGTDSICTPDIWRAEACSVATAETRYAWTNLSAVPGGDDQIGGLAAGMRWVEVSEAGTTRQYRITQTVYTFESPNVDGCASSFSNFEATACEDWNLGDAASSFVASITTTTVCDVLTDYRTCEWEGDAGALGTCYWAVVTYTHDVLAEYDPCHTNYACDPPYRLNLAGKSAAISFAWCSTATVWEAQEWFEGAAPTNCVHGTAVTFQADAALAYPLSNGWTLARTHASPVFTADLCITNYAAATNLPFAGSTSTNPVGWTVRRALLVNKWSFGY